MTRWLLESPIAHRGLHDLARGIPENTLPAFEASVSAGYGIELDVQQLGDGTLVVFHDHGLARATGTNLLLGQLSYQAMRGFRLFGTDARAPTLAEVLRLIDSRVPILLEIKSRPDNAQIARSVLGELRGYRGPLAVQSFDPFVLAPMRRRGIPLGQLAGPLEDDSLTTLQRVASRRLLTLAVSRPDFINYDLRGLPDAWVGRVATITRRPLLCWTVRNESDRTKAEKLRINYVFEGVRP